MLDENNNTKSFTPTWFNIPYYIVFLPGTTLGYIKVYEYIFEFWNKNRPCYLGIASLMKRTGLAKSQIYEAIAFYEKCGEIKRRTIDGKKYFIQPEKRLEIEQEIDESDSGIAEIDIPAQRKNSSGAAEHNIKKLNKEINNNIINTPLPPQQKKLTPREAGTNPRAKGISPPTPKGGCERFEEFWNIYPVKASKKPCLEKWIKKNLDSIADTILDKLTEQINNEESWKLGFCPNPLTYINQEKWTDEIRIQKKKPNDSFYAYIGKEKSQGGTYDQHGNAYDPFR